MSDLSGFGTGCIFEVRELRRRSALRGFGAVAGPFMLEHLGASSGVGSRLPSGVIGSVCYDLAGGRVLLCGTVVRNVFRSLRKGANVREEKVVLGVVAKLGRTYGRPTRCLHSSGPGVGRSKGVRLLVALLRGVLCTSRGIVVFARCTGVNRVVRGLISGGLGASILFLRNSLARRGEARMVSAFRRSRSRGVLITALGAKKIKLGLATTRGIVRCSL